MKVLLPKKGKLFVITAPSGTGKTTIIDLVRKKVEGIGYSVSHTTRPPRRGEVNGVHYCFVAHYHLAETSCWILISKELKK
jgi:guanylate kinase